MPPSVRRCPHRRRRAALERRQRAGAQSPDDVRGRAGGDSRCLVCRRRQQRCATTWRMSLTSPRSRRTDPHVKQEPGRRQRNGGCAQHDPSGTLRSFVDDAAASLSAETADGAEVPFEIAEAGIRLAADRALLLPPVAAGVHRPAPGDGSPRCRAIVAAVQALAARGPQRRLSGGAGVSSIPAEPGARARRRCCRSCWHGCSPSAATSSPSRSASIRPMPSWSEPSTRAAVSPRSSPRCWGSRWIAQTRELPLGDGLSLVRGDTLQDAPPEAVWGTLGTRRRRGTQCACGAHARGRRRALTAVDRSRPLSPAAECPSTV